MSFLRHVGKHGDRKVAVVFREVPGEPHMCLVVYTQLLGQNIHDPLIKCIESDIGQNSENLADALNRSYTKDGHFILQRLHAEGMLKKVNTENIVMTPAPNVRIKLNELNKILDEMKMGEEAVKRMAELDSQTGIQDPAQVARRMRGEANPAPIIATDTDVLGNNALVNNLRQQAQRMSNEAKGLLAEAERLLNEANSLEPVVTPKSKATTTTVITEKKGRGRPKKTPVVA